MKKMFRVLILCLALVMCMTPVLVACDKGSEGSSDAEESRQIAKYTHMDKSVYIVMYQLEETNGKDTVKCSLVCYKSADNSVIDSVTFDLKVNGEDAKFDCYHKTTWSSDSAQVIVLDHDGNQTTYTLKTK